MSSVLQQTLRDLCFGTGWCYAVFWKMKPRPRMVLTWEDAFYEREREDKNGCALPATMVGLGEQLYGGLTDMEDPIGLAVSKMSYHVYSVGEGIIGRVAFTNKHQWVFSSTNKVTVADGLLNRKAKPRMQPEKYPSGWEHQFAAGIKTIAVIAVPQGVVQLGSTSTIAEDLKLIGHLKALFGALQNVPGAYLSDLVMEGQRGGALTVYPLAVPPPQLPPRDAVLMNVPSPMLAGAPSLPANMSLVTAGPAVFNSTGVGRLPMMLASNQVLTHAHSWPLPPARDFQEHHSLLDKPCVASRSQCSFTFFKPLCTQAGPMDKMSTVANPSCITVPILSTSGVKANPPPRTGITSHLSLSSKGSSIGLPASIVPSPQAGHSFVGDSSLTAGEGVSVPMLRTHGGPSNFGGNPVATEPSDISSSIGSQKAVLTAMNHNLLSGVAGRSELESTEIINCGGLLNIQQLEEQPCCRPSEQSPFAALGRSLQVDSDRHLAKRQRLGSSRSQLLDSNPPSVEGWQRYRSSSVDIKRYGLVGNQLTGESRQLVMGDHLAGESGHFVNFSPVAESSLLLVDRSSTQSGGQYVDKQGSLSLQSGQSGAVSTSERSSGESSQPQNTFSSLPSSHFSGGLRMHLESSTSSTSKQESCTSEFLRTSSKTSSLKSEQILTIDSRQMHGQMSSLPQLAKQFENADRDDPKDSLLRTHTLDVDVDQNISSSLLCDDYFESLKSSKPLFHTLEINAGDPGSANNSMETSFTNELDDFDAFFSFLTKAEESILPQPVLFEV